MFSSVHILALFLPKHLYKTKIVLCEKKYFGRHNFEMQHINFSVIVKRKSSMEVQLLKNETGNNAINKIIFHNKRFG